MTRPPARRFKDLLVWQKAHGLVLRVYRLTAAFPSHELYGLTSQMRRACVSVPANLAEGFKRRSRPEKARFVNIAQGSLEEARYYLRLGLDLDYHGERNMFDEVDEVARMLAAYGDSILRSASA
jgi:four helix bundle protein